MKDRKKQLERLEKQDVLKGSSIQLIRQRLHEKLLKEQEEQKKEIEEISQEIKRIRLRLGD